MLDAWRERQADRLDPVRFQLIDALERHAANRQGTARRMLDERLAGLVDAYANEVERRAGAPDGVTAFAQPSRPGALGRLVEDIAAVRAGSAVTANAPAPAALPVLESLGEFRNLWTRVRARGQLRQSLEQVPANAGPLNSGSLVHRSLTLMRELSPGYLQHFLAYLDALSWMEQKKDAGAIGTSENARATGSRKRVRGKRAQAE
jgi:hypothetical protein